MSLSSLYIYILYEHLIYLPKSLQMCMCVCEWMYHIYITIFDIYIHIYYMTILHTHTVLVFTVTWFHCHLETFILQWQRPWQREVIIPLTCLLLFLSLGFLATLTFCDLPLLPHPHVPWRLTSCSVNCFGSASLYLFSSRLSHPLAVKVRNQTLP